MAINHPPQGGSGPPGPPLAKDSNVPKAWSSIASMNISKRNKTNTLEIRLESDQSGGCFLNSEEIERLFRRLNIGRDQFTLCQACPERKNVVYITLANGVDVNKFIYNNNKSFVLKPGLRTTSIKHASNKEVNVHVFGLHPDTKDEAVIRYLNAHGKVSTTSPVTYSVYPGIPGSSFLAGKRNGTRVYLMEVKKNIGSTHIIDREKVSIRYPGQIKTCNKCQELSSNCPGKGLARDCTADKILLSDYMTSYWKKIDFKPETTEMNENVDDFEEGNLETSPARTDEVWFDTEDNYEYSGVVIKGIKKGSNQSEILNMLHEAGLPEPYGIEDCQFIDKFEMTTVYVHDLKSETCVQMVKNIHRKEFQEKRLSAFSLVEDTPTKTLKNDLDLSIKSNSDPLKISSAVNGKVDTPSEAEENDEANKNKNSVEVGEGYLLDNKNISGDSSSSGFMQNISKFFFHPTEKVNGHDDDDSSTEEVEEDVSEKFKRKPSSEAEFETVKNRKAKKGRKKALVQQSIY